MMNMTQRRQGAFPWIRQGFMLFCGILVLLGSGAGVAQANQLYSATVPFFSDDLGLGAGNPTPTILIVVYGKVDVIEQQIKPAVANLNDFSLYPEGVLQVSPALGVAGIPLIVPEGTTDSVVSDLDAVDFEDLSGLAFVPIEEGAFLVMHPGDLLFFAMAPTGIHTIEPRASARGIELAFEVESLGAEGLVAIPELSSLQLLGIGLLGLLGVIAYRKMFRRDKQH
ncbi:MAG: hypothetical protein GY792_25875 [Gammaproteobacteria bacterium]|nr:hypothetical protein [Gammaproteobacteria bacterium]